MNIHLGKTHPSQYALIVAVCKRRAVGFSQLFFCRNTDFLDCHADSELYWQGKVPAAFSLIADFLVNQPLPCETVSCHHPSFPPSSSCVVSPCLLLPCFSGDLTKSDGTCGICWCTWSSQGVPAGPKEAPSELLGLQITVLSGWLELANGLIYSLI